MVELPSTLKFVEPVSGKLSISVNKESTKKKFTRDKETTQQPSLLHHNIHERHHSPPGYAETFWRCSNRSCNTACVTTACVTTNIYKNQRCSIEVSLWEPCQGVGSPLLSSISSPNGPNVNGQHTEICICHDRLGHLLSNVRYGITDMTYLACVRSLPRSVTLHVSQWKDYRW